MECPYQPPYPMGGTDGEPEPKIKRLAVENLPCKFAHHFTDSVPVPFGFGSCSMPGFECAYDGDKQIPEDLVCDENKECPAYEPVPVFVCEKHREEYFDICGACEEEIWRRE